MDAKDAELLVMFTEAHRIAGQIKPLIADHPPSVQGTVIADLLAIWISGHQGDPTDAAHIRSELLNWFMRLALRLVAHYDSGGHSALH